MLELYLLVALGSLGYVLRKTSKLPDNNNNQQQRGSSIPKAKVSSMKNIYHSEHVRDVQHELQQQQQPAILPPSPQSTEPEPELVWSSLLGRNVNVEEFAHNNMKPFGASKQHIYGPVNEALPIFESYTGKSEIQYKPKREVESFFQPSMEMANMNMMKTPNDTQRDRVENSLRAQNNILPFEQIKVGPGVNQGFSAKPMDKLEQDLEIRNIVLPKSVDDLRVANNQRIQYSGQMVESVLKEARRAEAMPMARNRPEMNLELTQDHLFRTTGAYLKEKVQPKLEAKFTNRKDTTGDYTGNARALNGQTIHDKSAIRPSSRASEATFGVRNASLNATHKPTLDHGKSSIQVYTNNRDTTTVSTYQGNLVTAVKAMVAPLTDALKITKKDIYAEHPRTFGQMQPTFPEKSPIRQTAPLKTTAKETLLEETPSMNLSTKVPKITVMPGDVARVTIKETVLAPSVAANLRGPTRIAVYDPEDVARVTMKQTTTGESVAMNVSSGVFKGKVYDAEEGARTTVKETTLHESFNANLAPRGGQKGAVYDPDERTRTTVKETTLHESEVLNMAPGAVRKGVVYDDDDLARTTVKETTHSESMPINVNPNSSRRGVVYDDSHAARMTTKETTLAPSVAANVSARQTALKGQVYDPEHVARTTIKETTLDLDAPTYLRVTEMRGKAIDPNMVARTTGRETLEAPDGRRVTRGDRVAGQVYNPDNIPKTTMKQTTLASSRPANPAMVYSSAIGGYVDANMVDRGTEREGYVDVDYYGGGTATTEQSGGYQVANVQAKETHHETTTSEYFGTGKGKDEKPMSYEDIYSATLNELREGVLEKRVPTTTGPKVTYGKDEVNSTTNKQNVDYTEVLTDFFAESKPATKVAPALDRDILPKGTRELDANVEKDHPVNTDILQQLQQNPYVIHNV